MIEQSEHLVNPFRARTPSPERQRELKLLLQRFGLRPVDEVWARLERALMHRSYRAEHQTNEDNERLEFLGDSVIGLVSTEYMLGQYPDADEGWLSKLRAALVSRAVLGRVAADMGIGEVLLLGAGEEKTGGRSRSSILGSALEAVCGAIYLSYPWEDLREPLRRTVIIPALGYVREENVVDYKSMLQEWTQQRFQKVPEYRLIAEGGPDHRKQFEVEVWIGSDRLGTGQGARIKAAENQAARHALVALDAELPTQI